MNYPFPEHAEFRLEENHFVAAFSIPESYRFLEGHFPGNPMVPAVIQIGWAVTSMIKMKREKVGAYRLSRFKFVLPIRPNDAVELKLTFKENKFRCRIMVNGQLSSSGTLELESDD